MINLTKSANWLALYVLILVPLACGGPASERKIKSLLEQRTNKGGTYKIVELTIKSLQENLESQSLRYMFGWDEAYSVAISYTVEVVQPVKITQNPFFSVPFYYPNDKGARFRCNGKFVLVRQGGSWFIDAAMVYLDRSIQFCPGMSPAG